MELVTNLLDKFVVVKNRQAAYNQGVICAVWCDRKTLMVSIVMEDGSLCTEPVSNIEIPTQMRLYSVWLYWAAHQKINAIKAIRFAAGMGLKDAKDHVEKYPNKVLVKDHLTLADAEELKRQVLADCMNKMEVEVRRDV